MAKKGAGKTDLGMAQLFRMGPKNLDKRFNDFYTTSKDALRVIQCAIAVMVRNGLSCGDFSFVAKELIRDLYLTNDEVRSMPVTCIYFRDYFSNEEWELVKSRLFSNEAEFQQVTGSTSTYLEPLRSKLNSGAQEVERRTSMISYFKDAAGKRHSWSLSNVNPAITKEEHYRLLSILSTLEIFEKEGVRRFAEPIYADFMIYHSGFDARQEEELKRLQQLPGRLLPVRTQAANVQEEAPVQTAKAPADSEKAPHSQQTAVQTKTEKATHASILAEKAGNPAELKAYLFEGFDQSSVSEEELVKLATVAVLQGKQVKDVADLGHLVELHWDDEQETENELEELFNFEELTNLISDPVPDTTEEKEQAASSSNRKLSRKERKKLTQQMQQQNRKKKGKGKRKKRK